MNKTIYIEYIDSRRYTHAFVPMNDPTVNQVMITIQYLMTFDTIFIKLYTDKDPETLAWFRELAKKIDWEYRNGYASANREVPGVVLELDIAGEK